MTTDAGLNELHQAQLALRDLLQGAAFSLSDLEELCFEQGLDWDNLAGEKSIKAGAIVQHYGLDQLAILKTAIEVARPNLRPQLNAIVLPVTYAESQVTRANEGWHFPFTHLSAGHFTGRTNERKQLTDWLIADAQHPLLVNHALGGFGKSELTWHWLNTDVDPTAWPRAMWWSFYESNARFDQFLDSAVKYLRVNVPTDAGLREKVDALLNEMNRASVLLVLDGFERELRAYSSMNAAYQGDVADEDAQGRGCINPMAEYFLCQTASRPDLRAKVLMTTRLRPSVLELRGGMLLAGCREIELRQLAPADAVALFRAVGIRGTRAEVEAVCAPYGYHPLSLRLLAGVVTNDSRTPGDITTAASYNVIGDLVQRKNHVLKQAYESLSPTHQRLLGWLACLRSAVSYDVLAAIEQLKATLDADLRDLVARGLVQREPVREGVGKVARYDLHPIVRRYAHDRLTGDERTIAHTGWRDYFADVPEIQIVQSLNDLIPVIELYHHMIWAKQYKEACDVYYARLWNPIFYQFGAYEFQKVLLRELTSDGDDTPRLKEVNAVAWMWNELGNAYSVSGQSRQAILMFHRGSDISEELGAYDNLARGLANAALDLAKIGALCAAEVNLRRSIVLRRKLKDRFEIAVGWLELGRLLLYRGDWHTAAHAFDDAELQLEANKDAQARHLISAYRAQQVLLMIRQNPHSLSGSHLREDSKEEELTRDALTQIQRAFDFANEAARKRYPVERDYVRAGWLLGAAQRLNGDLKASEPHLIEALTRCRRINLVEMEADILIDLARLRAYQGDDDEVARLLDEALIITERCEYALQGADVHLELAKQALRKGDRATALVHSSEARRLATCDGPPDYTYKVAFDEAGALLAQLRVEP